MKFRILISFVIFLANLNSADCQPRQKLLLQIDSLKAVLARAETFSPFDLNDEDIFDKISAVNGEIGTRLSDILKAPAVTEMNLDSIFYYTGLSIARLQDKRLWIFSWYANTGGSFHSYFNVVHYRTESHKPKVVHQNWTDEEQESADENLYSWGFSYDTVYRLKAKGRNLYLVLGGAKTCNTCVVHAATVVELTKDGIRFDYPAFIDGYHNQDEQYSPGFILESRIGSIEYFKFDTKTRTLSFQYTTDDSTPVKSEHEKVIRRKLRFDGKKFVVNGYE